MKLPRDLGGVVDQSLQVYGVKDLSVVDASVMPDLPGGYTQGPVYATSEKASHFDEPSFHESRTDNGKSLGCRSHQGEGVISGGREESCLYW